MPSFSDNTALITTASRYAVANNGTNDTISSTDTTSGPGSGVSGTRDATPIGEATAYVFSAGNTGDDRLADFDSNDTIINYQKIFDGNNDGIINFGENGVLDIDRTSRKAAGADQITVGAIDPVTGESTIQNLRYLGEKGGFVYADLRTLTQLESSNGAKSVIEGTVGDNTIALNTTKSYSVLYDTALGLNLGGDTISGFGADDELVTTTKIHNGKDAGALLTFGNNHVLDLPGDTNGIVGDSGGSEGGQVDFTANDTQVLKFLGSDVGANGVTYYHYGLTTAPDILVG